MNFVAVHSAHKKVSNGGPKRSLETLSETPQFNSKLRFRYPSVDENDENDDHFTKHMISFAQKAEHDHEVLKKLLGSKPDLQLLIEGKGVRLEFLKDPIGWINKYNAHTKRFAEDSHYLGYVVGLLEIIVNSSPYGEDRNNIYSPILLLQKMVSVEALKARRDPMRTALKLQYHLLEYAQMENDRNCLYDRKMEMLEQIPRDFAIKLIEVCVTPLEVSKLMSLNDETMFIDVLKSKNKGLVASKMYQKVVWQRFWRSELWSEKTGGKFNKTFNGLGRAMEFFFWNIFYLPLVLFSRCSTWAEKRIKIVEISFFSPFSSYLADILNYTILFSLLLTVIVTTIPDPKPVHLLIFQLQSGNITAANSSHFKVEDDGTILVKLPSPSIPGSEWCLWVCIVARILTEWYQAYHKKGTMAKSKLKQYFNSFSNLNDIVLTLLLLTGMICKLQASISSRVSGLYHRIDHERMVVRGVMLTIYFYCTAAVVSLVHLLQFSTIHVPGLGPLLRAIREMFAEISRVMFLFGFFLIGFTVPMLSISSCYRIVNQIDGGDDKDGFFSFQSFSSTVISLVWNLFGGLYNFRKENLYNSLDSAMSVCVAFLLVIYEVLLGIMCMNLLIAIMCGAYSRVNEGKFASWRYSQFESIMEYNSVTNVEGNGMPFLFPFNIPYIVFNLITKPCKNPLLLRNKTLKKGKDNQFARYLCQTRHIDFEDETNVGTDDIMTHMAGH